MKMTPNELRQLLRLIQRTREQELNCEEFLQRVAGYVERLAQRSSEIALAKTELDTEFKALQQHLEVCPECLEEFEALCRSYDVDPSAE